MKYICSTKKGVGTMKIEYKKKAVKYINSCDKSTKRRLKDSIEKLPLGDVKKLTGYECEYRLRIGNLRVLFTFENDIITINEIRPRGKAYKRL
ncbi:type II toxin-antitoxin system RelE family toxin [Anaerostipes caccae]|uniref:Toxin-antitoxin system, toxin component, RelE family n=3 Tax=Anaerostipes caccae TaxID=105841 RepID=B0MA31_ANACD|nr:hypothetical protein ANACAC_00404 [Anaerostipes caccae L1-92]